MLVMQAVVAVERFLDTDIEKHLAERVFASVLASKENIVLTGMPGSGKSTSGKIISSLTSREFVDTDQMIVSKAGMEITDIFKNYGENYFRDLESLCVAEASQKGGRIIATGGGAILRKENVDSLSRNGRIYFIDRPLQDLIPTSDRPLASSRDEIIKRYNERYSLYKETSDVIVDASCGVNEVAKMIVRLHNREGEVNIR